jgi:cystathionine beta-lyase
MGTISCNEAALPGVYKAISALGVAVGPDDAYLATRGLRTLSVRLKQHHENAMKIARWLQARPEVKRVLFPALPGDPGHALWKRDCSGASGLMGIVFHRTSADAVAAMIDNLKLFPLGYSWGGFESLACPSNPGKARTARPWTETMPGMRIHVGLEDPSDLIDDLDQGFAHFNRALV